MNYLVTSNTAIPPKSSHSQVSSKYIYVHKLLIKHSRLVLHGWTDFCVLFVFHLVLFNHCISVFVLIYASVLCISLLY